MKIFDESQLDPKFDFRFNLQLFADGEKTEEPTGKKREDARRKGQVARSQELNTSAVLLAGFFVLMILWKYIYANIAGYTTYIFAHLGDEVTIEFLMKSFMDIMFLLAKTALPVMFAVLIAGLGINFYQVGLMFSTEKLELNLEALNPINGMGRIFSKRSLVELAKSLLKIAIIGYFLLKYLEDQIDHIPDFIFYDLEQSLVEFADIIFMLAFKIIAVIIVLAVLDYIYQQWQTTQDLKMTKQEVKDEMKQTEGDPQIKGKIKQKQREMAMRRMMQEVPKADVIITNPTHFAVALMYHKGMIAPTVIAKGQDKVAQRIKEIAGDYKIPIVENKPLARALYASVEVGGIVPRELYQAVAEVLAYVYRLKNRKIRRSA